MAIHMSPRSIGSQCAETIVAKGITLEVKGRMYNRNRTTRPFRQNRPRQCGRSPHAAILLSELLMNIHSQHEAVVLESSFFSLSGSLPGQSKTVTAALAVAPGRKSTGHRSDTRPCNRF